MKLKVTLYSLYDAYSSRWFLFFFHSYDYRIDHKNLKIEHNMFVFGVTLTSGLHKSVCQESLHAWPLAKLPLLLNAGQEKGILRSYLKQQPSQQWAKFPCSSTISRRRGSLTSGGFSRDTVVPDGKKYISQNIFEMRFIVASYSIRFLSLISGPIQTKSDIIIRATKNLQKNYIKNNKKSLTVLGMFFSGYLEIEKIIFPQGNTIEKKSIITIPDPSSLLSTATKK